MWQVWVLPLLVYGVTFALAIPIGLYMARVFDGRLRAPSWLRWIESRLDTGPQNWKQYAFAFMAFNVVAFVIGFVVLTLQPYLPLNPDGKKMLAPTTIFNTVCSFLTNTNLQDYSGEVHLSYFSQLFFICWKQVLSPMIADQAVWGQPATAHGYSVSLPSGVKAASWRTWGWRLWKPAWESD